MKLEKWKYNGEEIDIPILDDEEIETNDTEDLEDTLDLTQTLHDLGDKNE